MKTKSIVAAGAAVLFTVAVSIAGESARPMMVDNDQSSYLEGTNYQDTVPGKKDKKKKDTAKKGDTMYVAFK